MTFPYGSDPAGQSRPSTREYARRVEDHYDMDSPRIKRVRVKDVLLPRVFDVDSPQVRNALAFRRRALPFCIAAIALFAILAWKTSPSQSAPSSTAPVSTSR
jgi:hypothetical protein